MAGDKSYLSIRDNKNKTDLAHEHYVGKMRYQNMFSLANWKYEPHRGLYEMETRLCDGRTSYAIWTAEIIQEIRNRYENNKPLTELEREAYDAMGDALEYIDEMSAKFSDIPHHFVFSTDHDY